MDNLYLNRQSILDIRAWYLCSILGTVFTSKISYIINRYYSELTPHLGKTLYYQGQYYQIENPLINDYDFIYANGIRDIGLPIKNPSILLFKILSNKKEVQEFLIREASYIDVNSEYTLKDLIDTELKVYITHDDEYISLGEALGLMNSFIEHYENKP